MKGAKKIGEKTKQEIEARLSTMGDYVKMDYLQRALISDIDLETRKFVLLRLAKIYETNKMFLEAGRTIKSAAEINTTFKDKIRDFMKTVELLVRSGNYQEADFVFAQTAAMAMDSEKPLLKNSYKNYVMIQAKSYLSVDKRNQAKKAFEKLVSMELNPEEKRFSQTELMKLYEKLGDIRSYNNLRSKLGK